MSQQPTLTTALPQFVSTYRHDVYPSIDSSSTLADAASSIKGVLVTGSGRGIGRATVLAFARAGAKKVVLTSLEKAELEQVKAEIRKLGKGTEVRSVEVDLTLAENVDRLFEEAGELDVLVNNAGYLEPLVPIRETNPLDWIRTQQINTIGTYLVTRAFLRQAYANNLVGGGNRVTVINTSSHGSADTSPGFSSYQPGKTFINRFTEMLHFDEPNVRTFAMAPGSILTKLARDAIPSDSYALLNDTPELPAHFSLWLATDERTDFLRGRYVLAIWDVEELLAKKEEILEKNLLWTRVVGQEQIMK